MENQYLTVNKLTGLDLPSRPLLVIQLTTVIRRITPAVRAVL